MERRSGTTVVFYIFNHPTCLSQYADDARVTVRSRPTPNVHRRERRYHVKTRKTVTLETKMLVNRKMEAGEKRSNSCSSLGLAPATVSTIMASAEKIKQSA